MLCISSSWPGCLGSQPASAPRGPVPMACALVGGPKGGQHFVTLGRCKSKEFRQLGDKRYALALLGVRKKVPSRAPCRSRRRCRAAAAAAPNVLLYK